MADPDLTVAHLSVLRNLGITVALDDFGTGHSSFAQLLVLPIDILKIDQSFIARIPHDERTSQVVAGMIQLAHALGLHVVAEGIETPEQLHVLRSFGCDLLQGFLLARPASPDDSKLEGIALEIPHPVRAQ